MARERAEIELKELEEKREALLRFTGTDKYTELGWEQQRLLIRQEMAMAEYAHILRRRLALWED